MPLTHSPSPVLDKGPTIRPIVTETWTRPADWVTLPSPGTQEFIGLFAVYDAPTTTNACSFKFNTSSGTYHVDWGDGSTNDYSSAALATHNYDYTDADLAGTECWTRSKREYQVTFTDSGDLVNLTGHGFSNDQKVQFSSITTTTGISTGTTYYIVNKTADNFQVASSQGGSALTLTNDGSGVLLLPGYKQAVVRVTPNTANITLLDLDEGPPWPYAVAGRDSGWIELVVKLPNATVLYFGTGSAGTTTSAASKVEHVNIISHATTTYSSMFQNFYSLQSLEFADSSATVTGAATMFDSCFSLTSVPLFNTANVTNMYNMFYGCYSLVTVPLFNTGSVAGDGSSASGMYQMFANCYSLTSVPLFDTADVQNMTGMFQNCYNLTTVPLFDTGSVAGTGASATGMNNMFASCSSLTTVPLFNTANVKNMAGMFSSCSSLTSVPLFNTGSVAGTGATSTGMASMFNGCSSLTSVPLFDTADVQNMSGMFNGCSSLTSVPLFNTGSVAGTGVSNTGMASMFTGCSSLTSVPLFDTADVQNMASMFANCYSLTSVPLFDTGSVAGTGSSSTGMASMFQGCYSLTSVPLFNTANVKNMASMFAGCYSLVSVPAFNTGSVAGSGSLTGFYGMFENCRDLSSAPALDTADATNMGNMFAGCYSLTSVPPMNCASVASTWGNVFGGSNGTLRSCRLDGLKYSTTVSGTRMTKAKLEEFLDALGIAAASQTVTTGSLWDCTYSTQVSNLTSTVGSPTLSTGTSPGNIAAGDELTCSVTGFGLGTTDAISVTFQDSGDTVTTSYTHGMSADHPVSFSSITSTTGIVVNTIYYVYNPTTTTFQLVSAPGGSSPITLTTDGSGSMRRPMRIVSYVFGVSVTADCNFSASQGPTSASLQRSTLQRWKATLKNWAVTM